MKKSNLFLITTFVFATAGVAHAERVPRTLASVRYTVPVSKPKLERYASFDLKAVTVTEGSNGLVIAFDLPANLVGNRPVRIELEQQGRNSHGGMHFEGDGGKADCAPEDDAKELTCSVAYSGEDLVYTARVARHLLFTDPLHFRSRLAVAREFGSDPIGTIVIRFAK